MIQTSSLSRTIFFIVIKASFQHFIRSCRSQKRNESFSVWRNCVRYSQRQLHRHSESSVHRLVLIPFLFHSWAIAHQFRIQLVPWDVAPRLFRYGICTLLNPSWRLESSNFVSPTLHLFSLSWFSFGADSNVFSRFLFLFSTTQQVKDLK